MTDRDALRAALAEALHDLEPRFDLGGGGHNPMCEDRADAILAHPAVLAALDNPSGVNCDCGREHHIVMYRDRNDPAAGLPICSECGVPIAEHPDTDACAIAQEAGVCPCWRKMPLSPGDALAASPTASPTATGEREP